MAISAARLLLLDRRASERADNTQQSPWSIVVNWALLLYGFRSSQMKHPISRSPFTVLLGSSKADKVSDLLTPYCQVDE